MILTNRVFTAMLGWQTLATCVVSAIIFFIYGKHAAISAGLGGFSIIFAAAIASLIFVRNRNKHDAAAILVSLIVSEMVKLVFVFSFLILVFKYYKSLVPVALIIGLMAAVLVSGAAMSILVSKE
jgi:ATP synthase protein I